MEEAASGAHGAQRAVNKNSILMNQSINVSRVFSVPLCISE